MLRRPAQSPRADGLAWASRLSPKVGASSCSTIRKSRRRDFPLTRVPDKGVLFESSVRVRAFFTRRKWLTLTWEDLMPDWLHTSLANGSDPALPVLAWRIGMAMALEPC